MGTAPRHAYAKRERQPTIGEPSVETVSWQCSSNRPWHVTVLVCVNRSVTRGKKYVIWTEVLRPVILKPPFPIFHTRTEPHNENQIHDICHPTNPGEPHSIRKRRHDPTGSRRLGSGGMLRDVTRTGLISSCGPRFFALL